MMPCIMERFHCIFVWHLVGRCQFRVWGSRGVEKDPAPHAESPGAAPSHLCEESLLPC